MSKWLLISDLHFGERGDSEKFNNSILDFIEWSIGVGKEKGIDKVFQFGDWFHHRNRVNVQTLNYAVMGARMLEEAFGRDNTYVLNGNHDLYYLDRLDVSSISVLDPYVTVIDEITSLNDNIVAAPWVTDLEMWDDVIQESKNHKYLFAHLELSEFMVNDRYTMENEFSPKELKRYEKVFSGHYHSKQEKGNILYMGTPYPITMNEANESHGIHIFDDETGEVEYIEYQGIKVISVKAEELEGVLEDLGDETDNVSIRVEFPDDLEDESLVEEVKERLHSLNFDSVKVKYRGAKAKQILESVVDIENVENIDELVISVIDEAVNVEGVDNDLLKAIYLQAKKTGEEDE